MCKFKKWIWWICGLFLIFLILYSLSFAEVKEATQQVSTSSSLPWWFWPLALFIFTFILGILAVLAGVGGGVLFVPLVSSFFPFHIDFVRGAGLFVALTGALAAGPGLLRQGFADLRLSIPMALIASTCAIIGALIGLKLPSNIVQILLGATIIFIVIVMAMAKKSEFPEVKEPDALSQALQISGIFYDPSIGKEVEWKIHRTPLGLGLFCLIGIIAGLFGLGAGWANVPVLNLILGAPIKVAVATSKFLLSITDTSAAWVYLNSGAVLPMIVVPGVVGIMLGSVVGVRVLAITKPKIVRWIVIIVLGFAGVRALLKGLGIWT